MWEVSVSEHEGECHEKMIHASVAEEEQLRSPMQCDGVGQRELVQDGTSSGRDSLIARDMHDAQWLLQRR